MKHKILIILSTVLISAFALIISLVWLFKIKYIEIDVSSSVSDCIAISDDVNSYISDIYRGKSIIFTDKEKVFKDLQQIPEIKVEFVEKSYPDRLIITVTERRKCFSIFFDDKYYITDSEFHLLEISDDAETDLTVIDISSSNLDLSSYSVSDDIKFGENSLFDVMRKIFVKFSDKYNLIQSVKVNEFEDRIYFLTYTGVNIEYRLFSAKLNPTTEEIISERNNMIDKTVDVEDFYNGLDENQKNDGYVLVHFLNDSEEIAIVYTKDEQ